MSSFGNASRHLIILPFEAWGHVRALCTLVACLVRTKPLTITFFTTVALHDRIDVELTRNFQQKDITLKEQIRLIALRSDGTNPLDIRVFSAAFAEAYKALVNEEPIACIKKGNELQSAPAPDAALIDMFAFPLLEHIRALSNKSIKTFCWTPCAAYATYSLVYLAMEGPEGGLIKKIEQMAAQTGIPVEDVASQILDGGHGIVGKVPGLPAMYDYEKDPQQMIINISLSGGFHLAAMKFFNECSGVVTSSPACYEPEEALSGFEGWLAQTSRRLYSEKKLSEDSAAIDAFLDSALQSHGAKSLIFISFGSFFWSAEPDKIWAVLDVLFEKNIPFIFSHGSPFANVPEEILARVKASGLGLLTRWAPQQAVLAHPATGWFVTHCGFNSVVESIVAGVPLICWPYQAEQPMNAAHLTDNLDVAYELVEVRTGERGLKPILRTGRKPIGTVDAVQDEAKSVLDKAFGEDGKKKRTNIMRLREKVLAAWDENGPSRQALGAFLDALYA